MSSSTRKHKNQRKVITCYICDKTVKDYRLSSHLLFGSLQCKHCNLKFRRCRDFDSFQKSKDKTISGSCAHRTFKWTRNPAEYIKRKLVKDVKKLKLGHSPPTTKEVVKEWLSYIDNLKYIENKSPWRRAIEKTKKMIVLKNGDKRHHKGKEKHHHWSSHQEGDKQLGNETAYPCQKINNKDKLTKLHKDVFQETCNKFQITDCSSNGNIVAQYIEEVIIPQTEWDIETQDVKEFQEYNNVVEISLSRDCSDETSLSVEEVRVTKDTEMCPMTLIIDEIDLPVYLAGETPSALEGYESLSVELHENCTSLSVESLENKVKAEDLLIERQIASDRIKEREERRECREMNKDETDIMGPNVCKKLSHKMELSIGNKYRKSGKRCATLEYQVHCGKVKREMKLMRNQPGYSYKHRPLHEDEDARRFEGKKRNVAKEEIKTFYTELNCEERSSSRGRKVSYKESYSEIEGKINLRCQKNEVGPLGVLTGKKYNLRSRRNPSSDFFLQKLNASEKKKLWEKLLPTAKKLRHLKWDNGVSLSTYIIPFDNKNNDDDFLIDILLSQVHDIQQCKSINNISSEENRKFDYNDGEEVTFLLNQINKVVRQFTHSLEKCPLRAAADSPNLSTNSISGRDLVGTDSIFEEKELEKSKNEHLNLMTFGKALDDTHTSTFHVRPPSDGNYYVINYPSQPLITECPMCYFRVFPSMFSLNLVTNVATTKCVGCMLTIYVVQEPSKNNSIPKIIFRRENSPDDLREIAKPARFKDNTPNVHKKVYAKAFFMK